jgi:hypothetical protein
MRRRVYVGGKGDPVPVISDNAQGGVQAWAAGRSPRALARFATFSGMESNLAVLTSDM